ncbi:MAG: YraN family protein [Pseudomonadales bacterium]
MDLPWRNKNSNTIGKQAEHEALNFLKQQGLKLLDKNYHCRQGEIDLVMQDEQTLVFIEVRYRKSAHFGSSAESVTNSKQRKIIHTAEHYLCNKVKTAIPACRFDVVAIYPSASAQNSLQFDWIKHAFQS